MRYVTFYSAICLCFVALPVSAVLDSDPNKVGVYFDVGAETILHLSENVTTFNAYIIVTNLAEAELAGLEVSYELVALDGELSSLVRTNEIIPISGINLVDSSDPYHGEYIIGLAVPFPAAPAIPIVTWEFMAVSADVVIAFELGPVEIQSIPDGKPAAEVGGWIIPLEVSTFVVGGHHSGYGIHTAIYDPQSVVPTTGQSFGSVKSLFR